MYLQICGCEGFEGSAEGAEWGPLGRHHEHRLGEGVSHRRHLANGFTELLTKLESKDHLARPQNFLTTYVYLLSRVAR